MAAFDSLFEQFPQSAYFGGQIYRRRGRGAYQGRKRKSKEIQDCRTEGLIIVHLLP